MTECGIASACINDKDINKTINIEIKIVVQKKMLNRKGRSIYRQIPKPGIFQNSAYLNQTGF